MHVGSPGREVSEEVGSLLKRTRGIKSPSISEENRGRDIIERHEGVSDRRKGGWTFSIIS